MSATRFPFSRDNPSLRYRELVSLYRQMHLQGEQFLGGLPENTFSGLSLRPQLGRIKTLIARTGSQTILDYGCGKGQQYRSRVFQDERDTQWSSVIDFWDVEEIACYDPCYEPHSKLPDGKFDGVISTDVLEHCPEEDMAWIVDEIFSFAKCFVFANVACFPADKRLPNGENAHCTIKPVEWWQELFMGAAAHCPELIWEVLVKTQTNHATGSRIVEQKIGNS